MATSNFGKLFDYDSNKEDWESYIKYLELFLIQTTLSGINHDRTQQRLLSKLILAKRHGHFAIS